MICWGHTGRIVLLWFGTATQLAVGTAWWLARSPHSKKVWGSNLGSGLSEWSLQEENSTDSVMWNRIETLVNLLTSSYLIIILPCQSPMYVLYAIV